MREIPYEVAFRYPEEAQWFFTRTIAIHPDGEGVIFLQPLVEYQSADQKQKTPEVRTFRLRSVRFDVGDTEQELEVEYRRGEPLGLRLSPGGKYLATIANGRLLVMDTDLRLLADETAELKDLEGRPLILIETNFSSDSDELLLVLLALNPPSSVFSSPAPRTVLMTYDWQRDLEGQPRLFKFGAGHMQAASQSKVHTVHLVADCWPNYRIAELDPARNYEVVWQRHLERWQSPLLFSTERYLFLAERVRPFKVNYSATVTISRTKAWQPNCDGGHYPRAFKFVPDQGPDPSTKRKAIRVELSGKIDAWKRDGGKRGPQLNLDGYALQWPIFASKDERWLVVRAVRWSLASGWPRAYSHWTIGTTDDAIPPGDIDALQVSDDRFALFDLTNPKAPAFLSHNLAPSEFILDVALSDNGSKLAVATTRRVLIYSLPASESGLRQGTP